MSRGLSSFGLPVPPNQVGDLPSLRNSRLLAIQRRAAAPRTTPVPMVGQPPLPPQRAVQENQRRQQPIKRFSPAQQEAPSQYRPAPLPSGKTWANDPREIMGLIGDYAKRHLTVIIRYSKVSENGRTVTRAVEPYSIRIRRRRRDGQVVRYFYGFDVNGPTVGIHSFIIDNIVSVQGTSQIFNPRWIIEF